MAEALIGGVSDRRLYGGDIQRVEDLHTLRIETDSGSEPLRDFGMTARGVEIEVVLNDIARRLIELIREADVVVGCVAWLTNGAILEALAGCQGASIIVQKEDFLRPDIGVRDGWPQRLRRGYEKLTALCRYDFPTTVACLSCASDPTMDPVRCVGNHNASGSTGPRSHHKFVVFCRWNRRDDNDLNEIEVFEPYAVWTGSFNFTETATRSFENAVVIRDAAVAMAFMKEYSQIAALSEPLDWESNWVQPEWRIGT